MLKRNCGLHSRANARRWWRRRRRRRKTKINGGSHRQIRTICCCVCMCEREWVDFAVRLSGGGKHGAVWISKIETSTTQNQIRQFNGKSMNEWQTNEWYNMRIITSSLMRAWMNITVYFRVVCVEEAKHKQIRWNEENPCCISMRTAVCVCVCVWMSILCLCIGFFFRDLAAMYVPQVKRKMETNKIKYLNWFKTHNAPQ